MSLPRLAAQRPLLAVLCACALIAAALLLLRAADLPGELPAPAYAAELADSHVDDGEDDEAVAHLDLSARPRDHGTPLVPFALHIAAAASEPPQSPPPEA